MITLQQVTLRNSQHLRELLDEFWEHYQTGSFFMSRAWLESWLHSLPHPPRLITFSKDNALVGFVLLQNQAIHRALPFFQKTLCNQTGIQRYDQVWIEFNRVYCHEEMHAECVDTLLSQFPFRYNDVQLYVSMADSNYDWMKAATSQNMVISEERVNGFKRALAPSSTVDSIIGSLSKNSRSQIRRSLKKAESMWGAIEAVPAKNTDKASELLELGELHKARWQHTSEGSGFSNEAFLSHHNYIIKHYPHLVDIIKVKAGTHTLGICYNFLWEKRVEFYCCGINEAVPDKHIKPGYLVHLFCMAHYANRGYTEYDFLGGDAQYKKTLASTRYHFYNMTIWANSIAAKATRSIARLKSLVNS